MLFYQTHFIVVLVTCKENIVKSFCQEALRFFHPTTNHCETVLREEETGDKITSCAAVILFFSPAQGAYT